MKLVKKVLLATDFAEGSNDAARVAMNLASKLGGEVVLMHVLPKRGIFAPIVDELKQQAKERLAGLKERFEAEKVEKVSIRVVNGEAFEEIVYYAEVMEVSLVVLGSGRLDKHERPRLGTTAERVIRHCRKPVWVVRPGSMTEMKRIVCPVDTSEHSARALRNAIRLAHSLEAELEVVHVVRPLANSILPSSDLVDEALESDFYDERAGVFDEFLERFDFGGVEWNRTLESGEPDEIILTRAEERRADLIVMGSVGRTGLSHLLMGSVALKVARDFPCSVLTVKDVDAFHTELQPSLDDIWSRYEQGQLELKAGRAEAAIEQFQICISRNRLFVRAWDGLADAHEKNGDVEAAERCRDAASRVYKQIWERQVENEIRARRTKPSRRPGPRYDE